MPFIGRDWRATGDSWVRTQVGWERKKLRPLSIDQTPTVFTLDEDDYEQTEVVCGSPTLCTNVSPGNNTTTTGAGSSFRPRARLRQSSECMPSSSPKSIVRHQSSLSDVNRWSASFSASSVDSPSSADSTTGGIAGSYECDADGTLLFDCDSHTHELEEEVEEHWTPHCFVKTNKSKEFVGCTSMSEAFHKLDMARAVTDVQRCNYVSKVVQILIECKLHNLSGSGRKILLSVVASLAAHSAASYTSVGATRLLLDQFAAGLQSGRHCGSPALLTRHASAARCLAELIEHAKPSAPSESSEDSVTLLDLPDECIRAVLRRLDKHEQLSAAADAHPLLAYLVTGEQAVDAAAGDDGVERANKPPVGIWLPLCKFHFTADQMEKQQSRAAACGRDNDWRHIYFELKKYHGLRELYADMIHICCQCKALFWHRLGHPCFGDRPPSVRVTPAQFVDMLMFL